MRSLPAGVRWRLQKLFEPRPRLHPGRLLMLEALQRAVVAKNKADHRLALLLAHQCECLEPRVLPETAALIEALKQQPQELQAAERQA